MTFPPSFSYHLTVSLKELSVFKVKIEYSPNPHAAFIPGNDIFASHLLIQSIIEAISSCPELLTCTKRYTSLEGNIQPFLRYYDQSFSSSEEDYIDGITPYQDLHNIFQLSLDEIISLTSSNSPSTSPMTTSRLSASTPISSSASSPTGASSRNSSCCGIQWYQVLPLYFRQLLETFLPSTIFNYSPHSTTPIATILAVNLPPKSWIDYTFLPISTPYLNASPLHIAITNIPLSSGLRRRRRFIYVTVIFNTSASTLTQAMKEQFIHHMKEIYDAQLLALNESRQSDRLAEGVGGRSIRGDLVV